MLFTTLKIAVAALLVVGVPKLSDWCPSMSGVIGVMPVFSLLFLLCVYFENGSNRKIVDYSATAAIGMIPAALFYLSIYYALAKGGLNILAAIGIGAGVWLISTFVYQILVQTV